MACTVGISRNINRFLRMLGSIGMASVTGPEHLCMAAFVLDVLTTTGVRARRLTCCTSYDFHLECDTVFSISSSKP